VFLLANSSSAIDDFSCNYKVLILTLISSYTCIQNISLF